MSGGQTTPAFLSQAWIDEFRRRVDTDSELAATGKESTFTFLWGAGADEFFVRVASGRLVELRRGVTINDVWDFSLRASAATWLRFLEAVPPPCYQHILAMAARVEDFHLDGNRLALMQNARVLLRLMTIARAVGRDDARRGAEDGGGRHGAERSPVAAVESIAGRYLRLPFRDRLYRVYFEEAGAGLPLVLLHTAGADSRQYMHLLNDPDFQRDWRMIAFDLPYHGRSFPPAGWWREEYKLTTDFYAEFILAVVRALRLERPVVLGCSMGGEIVLELAYRYPNEWRAVIGCEATHRVEGRWTRWTHHPAVNEAEAVPSWIDGLMAPTSPEMHRREVWWTYSQGGAGTFNGDIHFYSLEWNAGDRIGAIDTRQCPVYLLTGEYDFSCTPQATLDTAARIPGAKARIMKGIGHFPMAENPAVFKEYLNPILAEIRAGRAGAARAGTPSGGEP